MAILRSVLPRESTHDVAHEITIPTAVTLINVGGSYRPLWLQPTLVTLTDSGDVRGVTVVGYKGAGVMTVGLEKSNLGVTGRSEELLVRRDFEAVYLRKLRKKPKKQQS